MGRVPFIAALLMLVLGAGVPAAASGTHYAQVNLTADAPAVARTVDRNMGNPWGIARTPEGTWWIANHRDGRLVHLTGEGLPGPGPHTITVPLPQKIAGLPSTPTGVVYNDTADFILAGRRPARLMTATQEGVIAAWNRETGRNEAQVVVDNSSFAVYTGLAISGQKSGNRIYAANFRTGTIDVFDTYFHQVKPQAGERFTDRMVPQGYAPFNVRCIEGTLYVLYAFQDADRYAPEPGVGVRFVSVYDLDGNLLRRLEPGKALNSAWAMSLAPSGFGRFANMLLAGNDADGTIAAFDRADGTFRGFLEREDGYLVTIPGVRGMAFGRGDKPGDPERLYFCAGLEGGEHGLFGFIRRARPDRIRK